jgi:hypothetical protein
MAFLYSFYLFEFLTIAQWLWILKYAENSYIAFAVELCINSSRDDDEIRT